MTAEARGNSRCEEEPKRAQKNQKEPASLPERAQPGQHEAANAHTTRTRNGCTAIEQVATEQYGGPLYYKLFTKILLSDGYFLLLTFYLALNLVALVPPSHTLTSHSLPGGGG